MSRAEELFLEQKEKTIKLLGLFRRSNHSNILEQCKGTSIQAMKNFWSHVSPSKKQSTDITAVIDPVSGVIK